LQRIAVPMIGGMISSTLLTLIVIPAIYGLVKGLDCRVASASVRRSTSGTRGRSMFRMILNAKCVDRIPVFGISIRQ
jgi:hypothetical protein